MRNMISYLLSFATLRGPSEKISFRYGRQKLGSAVYGDDFLPELRYMVNKFVPLDNNKFLEWGSGLSTILLTSIVKERKGKLITIDNDKYYQKSVLHRIVDRQYIVPFTIDLSGNKLNKAGDGLNYSMFPLSLNTVFDFVLIDGRRRMECALAATRISHKNTIILLHDYRRERYQLVTTLHDVIEDGNQFRVMKVKKSFL